LLIFKSNNFFLSILQSLAYSRLFSIYVILSCDIDILYCKLEKFP